MASIGTKLFKIASQINVGKETIVAFLQAKGFAIENKATSTLTGDMVDLVLGNFQKEAAAALKQREKDAPQETHHEVRHDEQAQSAPAPIQSLESSVTSDNRDAEPVEAKNTSPNDVLSASALPSVGEELPSSEKQTRDGNTKADNGAAVGTVIQLDDSSSRRKSKKTKIEEQPQPSAEKTIEAEKKSKDTTTEKSAVPDVVATVPSEEHVQENITPAVIAAETSQPSTELQGAVLDEDASLGAKDEGILGAEEELDDTHEDHSEEGKRKRKKRIGEVEYFVDNAPYATPMPTGLTILGKIELGGRRGDGSSKDGNKAPERGGKPAERGGGRGGDGRAPRAGGDARPKPGAPAAAKPKDWTKPGSPAPVKKFGTVGGVAAGG